LDDVARYNRERWEELARARVPFSRPILDLNSDSARVLVDPEGMMGSVAEKDVLCLACGGGQQSAAFALLGARVTVLDFCETQLERDRQAAAHYGTEVRTVCGDMRDLPCFADDSFDLIWHAHSLTFVPDVQRVFREVARVIRRDGLYRLSFCNPFTQGTWESKWDGKGYPLSLPYVEGLEMVSDDPYWDIDDAASGPVRVRGPREFRHTLSKIVNTLCGQGFVVLGIWEEDDGDPNAEPGTWPHFKAIAAPWLSLWAIFRPEAFREIGD
jgi:SAM-dependent methyltransferase